MIEILQGAARYVQGPDAAARLSDDLRGLETVFAVGGETGLHALLPSLHLDGAHIEVGKPQVGKSTWEQARALAEDAVRADAQAVLGVGGGSALDLAKAVAALSGRRVYLAPTIAATCSAATTLVALYDGEGKRSGSYVLPRPVDGVYADETILFQAPARTLAAGIADGMAKLSETASACLYPDNPPEPRWRSAMAQSLHLMDVYFSFAADALSGDEAAKHEIVYANLQLVAGITATGSGRRIGEIAHAFYNGVTCLFPEQRTRFFHGEIVGVGVLLELELTGAVSGYTRKSAAAFLREVLHCPTTISDLGLPADEVALARLSAYIAQRTGLSPTSLVVALQTL
ncbi:MAG: iron-containing alcohol dehydrogenase [Candidatus Spyradocola sp.]|jgi:glycerol dehydrogenase-like iron-containing ADH family enzyme